MAEHNRVALDELLASKAAPDSFVQNVNVALAVCRDSLAPYREYMAFVVEGDSGEESGEVDLEEHPAVPGAAKTDEPKEKHIAGDIDMEPEQAESEMQPVPIVVVMEETTVQKKRAPAGSESSGKPEKRSMCMCGCS